MPAIYLFFACLLVFACQIVVLWLFGLSAARTVVVQKDAAGVTITMGSYLAMKPGMIGNAIKRVCGVQELHLPEESAQQIVVTIGWAGPQAAPPTLR